MNRFNHNRFGRSARKPRMGTITGTVSPGTRIHGRAGDCCVARHSPVLRRGTDSTLSALRTATTLHVLV